MNSHVYNASLVVGVSMVGAGVGMFSIPAGLIAAGALIVGLTVFGALLSKPRAIKRVSE